VLAVAQDELAVPTQRFIRFPSGNREFPENRENNREFFKFRPPFHGGCGSLRGEFIRSTWRLKVKHCTIKL
jgi:hypothetical protein